MFSNKIQKNNLNSLEQSTSLRNKYLEIKYDKNFPDFRGIQTSAVSKISLFLFFHKEFIPFRLYSHFYSQVLRFLIIIKRIKHTKTSFKKSVLHNPQI